ncbi:MobV family relaxase [Empedobacter sp.]|uniref:MobV family relaxase n=1 Tax=Empedobacter sp. TaxID=1927715 RepID=UPI0028AA1C28|nr:MobV family relaxase [Empedobacter sp.]
MGKAVHHIRKAKDVAAGLGDHIDRKKGKEHTFKEVVYPDKSVLNKSYLMNKYCEIPLSQAINLRIKEGHNGKRAIRDNAVRYLETIVSSDEATMNQIFNLGRGEDWVQANIKFFEEEYGKENIVRAVLHMDETTPHMHIVIVPLTKDGRLNAKELVGNRVTLQQRHTRYSEAVKEFGIERGVQNSGATHKEIHQYRTELKQAKKEVYQQDKIEVNQTFLGINRLDKDKTIEELNEALSRQKYLNRDQQRILNNLEVQLQRLRNERRLIEEKYSKKEGIADNKYRKLKEELEYQKEQYETDIETILFNSNFFNTKQLERLNDLKEILAEEFLKLAKNIPYTKDNFEQEFTQSMGILLPPMTDLSILNRIENFEEYKQKLLYQMETIFSENQQEEQLKQDIPKRFRKR